jgi:CHAT domain-containing protein/Flp pilus assembly protein TadD
MAAPVVALALAFGFASPSIAQSKQAKDLEKRIVALFQEGRYSEAIPLAQQVLAMREKTYGPSHSAVGMELSDIAQMYVYVGRHADAEPLFSRSLAIFKKALGPNHPAVAATLANLGLLYDQEDRYTDAEPLLKRALSIEEKAHGPNDPNVAHALVNLAVVYNDQARYADAEPLLKRALQILEKTSGPDSPDVGAVLNDLAIAFKNENRYGEAEALYKRNLAIKVRAFGPVHPVVASVLNNLAELYRKQKRYADAEPIYKQAIGILEKVVGSDHPDTGLETVLNNLTMLYGEQGRYGEAWPLVQRAIEQKTAQTFIVLPVLFGGQAANAIPAEEALDKGLDVVQRASQTSAGKALNDLAARVSAGSGRLAELVRKDQDLAAEAAGLDKRLISAASQGGGARAEAGAGQDVRDRIAAVAKERDDLSKVFSQEFPDYLALSRPEPLTVKDIQALLDGDEALVVVRIETSENGPQKSYVWAITQSAAEWREIPVKSADLAKTVSVLRNLLDVSNVNPFDAAVSFELYRSILAPVADLLAGKPRLSFVLNGALTSLPPQLLVTEDPSGKALKDVGWLIRTHAVTVLPSIASLKGLRGKSAIANASKPLIGFANPVFDPDSADLAQNIHVMADVTASRGIRGTVADVAVLRTALPPLPDTADELRQVATSVHGDPAAVILGQEATESRVKRERLDQYRIVYFATHGLLAGDVAEYAKLNAEPALVLSLPDHPTEFDDGLLTASEVAQLKLNADWVVLSACNTASGEKPGAEALSGLARAFFYAGARSLIVSNWEVDSPSAVELMTGTFAALNMEPSLSHAEALQKSMLAMIDNPQHPQWADPKYWAPFIVVGEPAKPNKTNK